MASTEVATVEDGLYENRFESKTASVNGLRLHYTDWNRAGGRPVVMVHGLSANCHTWDPIADVLSKTRRVVCLDLRGHGQSQWAEDGYFVDSFVSDIEGLADELGLDRFDYVGHSLGAHIGIAVAGARPDAVAHLVLNDLGPEMPKTGATNTRASIARDVKGFRAEEEAVEYFREANPGWQEVFYRLHARYQLRRNWVDKLVFRADPELFWLMGSAGVKRVPWVWEMAERVTAPTLLLRGMKSDAMNNEIVERMQTVIKELTVRNFDVGHFLPREQPDVFLAVVNAFLDDEPLPVGE